MVKSNLFINSSDSLGEIDGLFEALIKVLKGFIVVVLVRIFVEFHHSVFLVNFGENLTGFDLKIKGGEKKDEKDFISFSSGRSDGLVR